jgi:hypothetical protein
MMLAMMSDPFEPLSTHEYAAIGRASRFDPTRIIFCRHIKKRMPSSMAGSMYGVDTWKLFSVLQTKSRSLHNAELYFDTATDRARLDYIGWTYIRKLRLQKDLHTLVNDDGTLPPGSESILACVKVAQGRYDMMWRSTWECIEAMATPFAAPRIELHTLAPGCTPPKTARAPDTVRRSVGPSIDVSNAHLLTWGYLRYLIT